MLKIGIRSTGIWLCFVIAAIINGAVREKLLTPLLGSALSLPLSGVTLSALVFLITYFTLVFLGEVKPKLYLRIGLFWIVLTLAFEYLWGHYVAGKSWDEIHQVFNIFKGNLFIIVLIVTALSPRIAARLKGIV